MSSDSCSGINTRVCAKQGNPTTLLLIELKVWPFRDVPTSLKKKNFWSLSKIKDVFCLVKASPPPAWRLTFKNHTHHYIGLSGLRPCTAYVRMWFKHRRHYNYSFRRNRNWATSRVGRLVKNSKIVHDMQSN